MELKIFRDTLPQAGASCTVKAELPLETEILISDYLPPVFIRARMAQAYARPNRNCPLQNSWKCRNFPSAAGRPW